ncbi:KH domain-containing protein [archaeon]|nr:KH domain-containing protein [archaeon]
MPKICNVCLKNDFLCNACNKSVLSGKVSTLDVSLSRAIYRLGIEADFSRAMDAGNYMIVLTDKNSSGILIGKGGRNSKRLGMMLEKNLRIIEDTNDEKKLIESIVSAPIVGINKVYGKEEYYKVRMEKRFKERVGSMSPVLSKVVGKEVKLMFE